MSLKILNIKEISKKYTAYFFDLDGVIVLRYIFSGEVMKR